jgi:predicted dehydrogenase
MKAPNTPVRIGFCGVGTMGQCAHLRNYYTLSGCKVVALAELREETAQAVARRYNVPVVYPDAAAMLANEELDAIVASQPFSRHGVLLPELLAAGIPVFIEKPLAGTLASGQRIVDAVKASGTWLMVGYHKRSDPACMYALEQVQALQASGALGKMTYIRSLMPAGDWVANGFFECISCDDPVAQLEFDPPPGDMDADIYREYTAFVNYYIHQVNLLRYFLGEPYQLSYADPSGVLLAGVSASGIACTIEMSPYCTTLDWQESVLIAFERGYVKVELPAPLALNRPGRVEILRDPGNGDVPETTRPQMPWVHAMRQQAINFVAAVQNERPPTCTAEEALEDLQVARQYIGLRENARRKT